MATQVLDEVTEAQPASFRTKDIFNPKDPLCDLSMYGDGLIVRERMSPYRVGTLRIITNEENNELVQYLCVALEGGEEELYYPNQLSVLC